MTVDELRALVDAEVRAWAADVGSAIPEGWTAELERPKSRDHGDYATNAALTLAKISGIPPRDIADAVATRLSGLSGILSAEVAGPGFVNLRLESSAQGEIARIAVEAGTRFGSGTSLAGRRINVEFISANPTGPLHLGHTRWAAVGDALARVLTAAGAQVTTEFYINDRGVQMDRFGASVMAAAHGRPVPEDGYHGGYITDLAARIIHENPGITSLPEDEQLQMFRDIAYAVQLAQQQSVLEIFRTRFDVWSSERALHESGAVQRGIETLEGEGHTFVEDRALWLRTTDFGDDKDRVLRKADGEFTYFASDTAYYVDKRNRGFDRAIYLLGADHHGYVNRLRAVAACAGDDPDLTIEVLIGQLVKITRGDEEIRLSKRAGTIVTLEDLVEEVGVDAARYTLTRYPVDSPLTMDLDVVTAQTNDNPVFYVQYAHARIASVLRNAHEIGVNWRDGNFDPGLLTHEKENEVLGLVAQFPGVVASAAELREPHRIARYLETLATGYHRFYDSCRVLPRSDETLQPIHIARLWLCAAVLQTLANGLDLLGVSAPERM